MFRVSKDSPAYYLTAVTKDRLPIFRTSRIAELTCRAIDEARKSARFLIFAYVLMPDHLHLITDSKVGSKDVHRFVKGIVSRRVIDHPELDTLGCRSKRAKSKEFEASDSSQIKGERSFSVFVNFSPTQEHRLELNATSFNIKPR